MKFTASNVTQKTASTGKPMWNATFTGEDGASTVLNLFEEVKEGQELNGELYVNKKGYTSFKSAQKANGANFAAAKKEESINRVMDRKEEAIEHSGSIKYATEIVTAMLNAKVWANVSEDMVKNKVREYIVWYKELYSNPQAVAPF